MMSSETYERVCVSVAGDTATIESEDAAAVQLPLDIVYRSSLLRHAVSETSSGDLISLSLPKGVLELWLDGLKDLDVHVACADCLLAAPLPDSYGSAKKQLEHLKAADFIDDADAVIKLRRKICYSLFAPYIDTGALCIDDELAQELLELPRPLRLSVLATRVPVIMQLALLPDCLRRDALHAAFPSIVAESSLTVSYGGYSSQFVEPFWALVGEQTGLTRLKCTSEDCESPQGPESMYSALRKLTNLVALILPKLPLGDSCVTELIQSLSCQKSLRTLELSEVSLKKETDDVPKLAECLAEFTALESLNIAEMALSLEDITALAPSIARLTCLKSLNMNGCKIQVEGSAEVQKILLSCTQLTTFRFNGNSSAPSFTSSLRCCPDLQELELPSIPDPGMPVETSVFARMAGVDAMYANFALRDAAEDIAQLTNLRELWFPRCGLVDEELRGFGKHFTSLTLLRDLKIRHTEVTTAGARGLGGLLSSLPGLQCMVLLRTGIDILDPELHNGVVVAIASCLTKLPGLLRITLHGVDLALSGTRALIPGLQSLTSLQDLDLTKTGLNNSAARALAQPLGQMQHLSNLNLTNNRLGDKGVVALAVSIGKLTSMQVLRLDANLFIAEGMAALAAQFSKLPCLVGLSLGMTKRNSGAAACLAPHLGCLSSLKLLGLGGLHIDSKELAPLIPEIAKLTALTDIVLGKNKLVSSDVDMIFSVLPGLVYIKNLQLWCNRIGDEGARTLVKCVRTYPSLHVCVGRNKLSEMCIKEISSCPLLSMEMDGFSTAQNQ